MVSPVGLLDGWAYCPRCARRAIRDERQAVGCAACGFVTYAQLGRAAERRCRRTRRARAARPPRASTPTAGSGTPSAASSRRASIRSTALRREVREETGLEFEPRRLLGIWMGRYGRTTRAHAQPHLDRPARPAATPRRRTTSPSCAGSRPTSLPAADELAFDGLIAAVLAALAAERARVAPAARSGTRSASRATSGSPSIAASSRPRRRVDLEPLAGALPAVEPAERRRGRACPRRAACARRASAARARSGCSRRAASRVSSGRPSIVIPSGSRCVSRISHDAERARAPRAGAGGARAGARAARRARARRCSGTAARRRARRRSVARARRTRRARRSGRRGRGRGRGRSGSASRTGRRRTAASRSSADAGDRGERAVAAGDPERVRVGVARELAPGPRLPRGRASRSRARAPRRRSSSALGRPSPERGFTIRKPPIRPGSLWVRRLAK